MGEVKIVEVGARDGLQNEKTILPLNIKIELIEKLISSGLRTIEATSFVSAKWVPQMGDHEALVTALPKNPAVRFPILVPNQQGLDKAIAYQVKDIAVFAAASETFSQKNMNKSINQSLSDYQIVIARAKSNDIRVRGYVSCVLGCPYEGNIALSKVVEVAKSLFDAGCEEISLGDTIGVGTPIAARKMVKVVMNEIPIARLAIHFHDTYGQALANILACLELGVKTIDSAVAGLGGCPYAKGATGNVATEDVVYMLNGMGLHTGVDLNKLIQAGEFICSQLKTGIRSKAALAMIAKRNELST